MNGIWEEMSEEQKQEFYRRHHGQIGFDLKAAIRESVTVSQTERTTAQAKDKRALA